MLIPILLILLGFVLLVKGGDLLVEGSVAIARRARLSPMVIGITVMGFGTSMPELLVSVQAAWAGSSGIAIGNVAGSNIANIALILGATALLRPLPSGRKMMRIDIPFMLLAMLLLILCAWSGDTIQRWQGILMFLILCAYVTAEVRHSRRSNNPAPQQAAVLPPPSSAAPATVPAGSAGGSIHPAAAPGEAQPPTEEKPLWRSLLLVLISLAAMIWGADLLVSSATTLARQLGEQFGAEPASLERIIGLTVVAVGTSLPELFASVISARKGQTDMAVGNIVGSVSFNILCVVGLAAAITPIPHAFAPFATDYAVMLLLGILLWLFLHTRHLLDRWEGAILLLAYILYIIWTVFNA